MKDLIKATDISDAIATIKVLDEKVRSLQEEVNMWKINFEVDVEQEDDGSFSLIIIGKVGDTGLRWVIPEEDIMFFAADKETLIKEVSSNFLTALLGDTTERLLRQQVLLPFKNAEQLILKRGKTL